MGESKCGKNAPERFLKQLTNTCEIGTGTAIRHETQTVRGGSIMPKDLWQKARNRDIQRQAVREQQRLKSDKLIKHPLPPTVVAAELSPNSRLWFGKYKGRCINQIPCNYLSWLTSSEFPSRSWRMHDLILFLRHYLEDSPNLPGSPCRASGGQPVTATGIVQGACSTY
jgi:uncharacterized protein (DUF3820 family)